jgi:hypothetical protein
MIQIMAGIHRKACRNKFKILLRKQLKWFKVTTGKNGWYTSLNREKSPDLNSRKFPDDFIRKIRLLTI